MSKQNPVIEESEEYKVLAAKYSELESKKDELYWKLMNANYLLSAVHYIGATKKLKCVVKEYVKDNGL